VFYERLPAAGYQVREEQIYFAFRVADALRRGRPLLAEAGAGTGKTFAYLLPAICHARLHGRPVVVATATSALLAQLADPDGDIATLSRLLDLDVDARVVHRPEDVVCDLRLERWAATGRPSPERAALLRWAEGSRLGVRGEYGGPDAVWSQVAWNPGCRCDICPRRGYCRLTRGRAEARAAADLIVCSHDLFCEDLFRRDRLPPGRLPVLPPFSAAVLDEGQRVAAAAQRAAGGRLRPGEVITAVRGCAGQGVRLRLLAIADAAEAAAIAFASALRAATVPGEGPRRPVQRTAELLAAGRSLRIQLQALQDEMAIEQDLHAETEYGEQLAVFRVWLEDAEDVLAGLGDPGRVLWAEGEELWSVPAELGPLWRRHLPAGTPLVFSSATLAVGGSFAYTAASLGLEQPLTARVGVPFRLARQVLAYLPPAGPRPEAADFWQRTAAHLRRLLRATGGRALILLPGPAALARLRAVLRVPFPVLWEGDGPPGQLLAAFARDRESCLVGHSFWEGVDVPGETLSAVVIPLLPLPGDDPLVEARRDAARAQGLDPHAAVDVPAMVLRLKQGIGRLIRSESDRGVVALLDGRCADYAEAVVAALPAGVRRVATMPPVRRFLDAGDHRPAP
jgi:ATP-dependent DNA helicase DinG